MQISILFPSSWDRKRILRATRRLSEADDLMDDAVIADKEERFTP